MSRLARTIEAAFDVDTFLTFLDSRPDERWELIDGHPVMMTGGTLNHNTIALNTARLLYLFSRKSGCRVQSSDVLVKSPLVSDFAAFPDVMVHCGPRHGQERVLSDPTIIVEVLSRSTVIFDRDQKFAHYRAMPSVQQIVFIYQDQVRVENWTRTNDIETDEPWSMQTIAALDRSVRFTHLNADISIADIYDDALQETGTA